MSIHSSAIIGKKVDLGKNNEIGRNVVIEDGVKLGSGNKIWAGAYIALGTEIGNENQIHMHAVIGHTPQDLSYKGAPTKTVIGNNNVIREFVTIHRGTKEGTATLVKNNNFIMAYAHIGHNCQVGNDTILINGATLGGYCEVGDAAYLSAMIVVQQFTRIGRLALVSGLSGVVKDLPPFMLCGNRRAIVYGLNTVGLRRAGIPPATRNELKQAYKILYKSGLNVRNALSEIEQMATTEEVKYLADFIRSSKRGICGGVTATRAKEYAIQGEETAET